MDTASATAGPDGLLRCPWSLATPDYCAYHDNEWGKPIYHDAGLYERLALEAFQAGLSWLTILRKREAFRRAFADFDARKVADFTEDDVERLLNDPAIVRNRAKITATITNARALCQLQDAEGSDPLATLIWSHAPADQRVPHTLDDIPSQTKESAALAKALKSRGFAFVGPTTIYATMQAAGVVNDHLVDCHARRL